MTEDRDWEKFESEAEDYIYALNHVREKLYGTGGGSWSNLPGSCSEFVRNVVNDVWYQAFEREHFMKSQPINREEAESSGE